jgi:hypothetical protein
MRSHNRRAGDWYGRGAISGLILRLFGSVAASNYGTLAGEDDQGGGWLLVCPEPCEAAPIYQSELPSYDSRIWYCDSGHRRVEHWQEPKPL